MDVSKLVTISGCTDELMVCIDYIINTLLIHRGLYSFDQFFYVKRYGVAILRTNNAIIRGCKHATLSGLEYYLNKRQVISVSIMILECDSGRDMERWEFLINTDEPKQPNEKNPVDRVQEQLFNVLKYIGSAGRKMKKLEKRCTFEMLLRLKPTVKKFPDWKEEITVVL